MARCRPAELALLLAWMVIGCGGSIKLGSKDGGAAGTGSAGGTTGGAGNVSSATGLVIHQRSPGKVDLLFMIANSSKMSDEQALLAQAAPDLLTRLVQPNCVDSMGNVLGQSDSNGECTMGRIEFPAVHDMHIGIVTSALGGRGGNQCPPDGLNEANPNLSAHYDDEGHLINRGGADERPIGFAGQSLNFLTWYPPVAANKAGANTPPATGPETSLGATGMPGTLIGDFVDMIQGVHDHGCGYEANNEAWYRFLVQPDPFDGIGGIQVANNRASLVGLDATILQQRAKFLRPDSVLVVIVVTRKNEEVANPLSVGGQGWLYESAPFPSSPTYGAPEGTIECKANPNDPNCTSCAFTNIQISPNFATECPDDPPMGMQGFLDPSDDSVNVRFFNQKQRFGIFAGYPTLRYVRGLQKATVPDRTGEVDGDGNYIGDQDTYANCINPIFAQNLPTDPQADLCHLTRGPRTPDLVYYAAIAGVPHQLLQAQAGVDPECPAGTRQEDCPQKNQLTEADWLLVAGKNPDYGDSTGISPYMLESEYPRAGLPCNASSNDNCDPINGREWSTNKKDLQFACIFPLVDPTTGLPAQKVCTDPQYTGACDCESGSNSRNTPLCAKVNGAYSNIQINGGAYPSIREMAIAHDMANSLMGVQGIVSSVCPIHTSFVGSPVDPLLGYRPAMKAIVDRIRNGISVPCLPQKLSRDPSTGSAPCTLLLTLPEPGDERICTSGAVSGLLPVDPTLLRNFRAEQELIWQQQGSANSGLPDPDTLPVCALRQLTVQRNPADFDAGGSCQGSQDPGWCYVEGQAAGSCTQQILFTPGEPPPGASVNLLCP